ncbi:hypothetical protein [Deinococcus sp. QL22]|uniref:hypothetical protein n=1 Tax=Deinococcus sp. QL22 TaxID=2939437 RepID=UPI002017D6B5|nr:hypothetical protein [Deinococcus sp. QL22]UQN05510.1 hypothetical protein M1R55_11550 [Deinococcus sp. QL22]
MKTTVVLFALALSLSGCKDKPTAAVQPTLPAVSAAATSTQDAFERASDQYLIDTNAVKTECSALFPADRLAVYTENGERVTCGQLSDGLEGARRRMATAHGKSMAVPWESNRVFTSSIFDIEDDGLMSVYLFEPEQAVLFQSEQ